MLCDWHDLPVDNEAWLTSDPDVLLEIEPKEEPMPSPLDLIEDVHYIPPEDPTTLFPVLQMTTARPKRPQKPESYVMLMDATERQSYERAQEEYAKGMEKYMKELKDYQVHNRLIDEPKVYDPDKHPNVEHKHGKPFLEDDKEWWLNKDFYTAQNQYNKWLVDDYNFMAVHDAHTRENKSIHYRDNNNYKRAFQAIANDQDQGQDQDQDQGQDQDQPNVLNEFERPKKRPVSLDLMHRRLGHRAAKSILLANDQGLYADTKIIPAHDPFCATCKIATIRSANRGQAREEEEDVKPGQHLYIDVQPNVVRQSLTRREYFTT